MFTSEMLSFSNVELIIFVGQEIRGSWGRLNLLRSWVGQSFQKSIVKETPSHSFQLTYICEGCCAVLYLVARSCSTLCNPVAYGPTDSSVHGTLQARILEWVVMPSSKGSSQPTDQTCISSASCTSRRVLYQ